MARADIGLSWPVASRKAALLTVALIAVDLAIIFGIGPLIYDLLERLTI